MSTKYTLGDFYTWLPLNHTLEQGDQRRIVEFQSRREFENFGAFPNDLGPQYQAALQQLLAANERVEGVWIWTQDGGPWRAGPMSLYLKSGFWQLYELNTQIAAALAQDPETDVAEVTADWARRVVLGRPRDGAGDQPRRWPSRATPSRRGCTSSSSPTSACSRIGLEPPPMMWIFEWDILTGDSAVLDVLYAIVRDSADEAGTGGIDAAIAGGAQAVADVERMRDLVTGTDAATWRSPDMRDAFVDTLDYELDTLRLLQAYRAMILHQGEWHDTLSPDAYARWDADRADYEALAAAHLERYEGDIDYPAFNLTAAQLGVERAERDLTMAWLARGLLLLALAWVVIGMLAARTRLVRRPGAAAARATWIASTRPWRARESTLGLLELDRWLLLIVPAALLVATRAVQTSFLSWTHVAVTIGAWVVFALVVRLFVWRRSPWPVIAAVGGVVMLRCILTLFAAVVHGTGRLLVRVLDRPRAAHRSTSRSPSRSSSGCSSPPGGRSPRRCAHAAPPGTCWPPSARGSLIPSTVVGLIGLEAALTLWNDEMGLLPWGLARILGITTYLEIPDATPWAAAAFGAVLLVVGTALALPWRRRERGRRTPPPEGGESSEWSDHTGRRGILRRIPRIDSKR